MANIPTAIRRPMVANDSQSFGVIFVLSYPVLLAIALIGQLLGWHWRDWLPGAEGASVFGGVKAAVYTFMSHLL